MSIGLKKQFLGGAMALTLSTALVKVIGLVYKIPLMRVLGASGMGYFNSAYEIYTLLFVISSAGIPVAISIMISESIAAGKTKNAERIYKISFWLLFFVGLLGSLILVFGVKYIALAINNEGAAQSLVFIAPTVFFISISGAVRGYFQGHRNMMPTAVSQIMESAGKLILGLFFAIWAKSKGMSEEAVSAFAVLGLSVGTAISTVYLCMLKAKKANELQTVCCAEGKQKSKHILKKLLSLAIPVTVSSVLVSLTRIIDMAMLLNRLGERADKLFVYGSYSTMALPVYNLPSSLIAGIALALVPSITDAVRSSSKERERQLVASGFRLCSVIALPCALGIGIYSYQVLSLIFPAEVQATQTAAPLLSALGTSVLASCFVLVSNSVLQANGKIICPIISMLGGVAVKCVSSYLLIGIEGVGAMGAPISTLLCNITAVVLNLYFMDKYTNARLSLISVLFKPTVSAVACVSMSILTYLPLVRVGVSEKYAFGVAFALCALAYLIAVLLFDVLDKEELFMLPLGERLYGMREKIKRQKGYKR